MFEEDEWIESGLRMAGCIRDSMEWWGIRVQWNCSLMSDEIFCLAGGVW